MARRSISWAIIFNLTITPVIQLIISLLDEKSTHRKRLRRFEAKYQRKWFWRSLLIALIPFRGLHVALEEIYYIIVDIKRIEIFKKFLEVEENRPRLIKKQNEGREKLSSESIEKIASFYDRAEEQNERKLALMTAENSIQLIYQSTILFYEYFNPPIYELDFSSWSNPRQFLTDF